MHQIVIDLKSEGCKACPSLTRFTQANPTHQFLVRVRWPEFYSNEPVMIKAALPRCWLRLLLLPPFCFCVTLRKQKQTESDSDTTSHLVMEALPIPTDTFKLGFIGAGKMAESIARGIVRSGVLPPNRISTFHANPIRRQAFESFGVELLHKNDDVWPSLPFLLCVSVCIFCGEKFELHFFYGDYRWWKIVISSFSLSNLKLVFTLFHYLSISQGYCIYNIIGF